MNIIAGVLNNKEIEPRPNPKRKSHLRIFQEVTIVLTVALIILCAIIFYPIPKQTPHYPVIVLGQKIFKSDYNWTVIFVHGKNSAINVRLIVSDTENGNITFNSSLQEGNDSNLNFRWNDNNNDDSINSGDNITIFGYYHNGLNPNIKEGYHCRLTNATQNTIASWPLS
jgi:hypothetical protein